MFDQTSSKRDLHYVRRELEIWFPVVTQHGFFESYIVIVNSLPLVLVRLHVDGRCLQEIIDSFFLRCDIPKALKALVIVDG